MNKQFLIAIAALLMIAPLSAVAEDHNWWLVDFSVLDAEPSKASEVCVPVTNPDHYVQAHFGYDYSMIDYDGQGYRKYFHLDTLKLTVFAASRDVCYDLAKEFLIQRMMTTKAELESF